MAHFLVGLLAALIIIHIFNGIRLDDTDLNKDTRSGLRLYTDHGTGVQYLGTFLGGITPRLNADGTLHTVDKSGGK